MEVCYLLKIYFNKKAFEALAREFCRASWGATAASAAVGYQTSSGIAMLLGAGSWAVLQILAFIVESIRTEEGGEQ